MSSKNSIEILMARYLGAILGPSPAHLLNACMCRVPKLSLLNSALTWHRFGLRPAPLKPENLDCRDELWTAVAGSPPPDSIASSFAYLKSVNSGVALSPQLNLLLDAARQGSEKGSAPASRSGNTSTLVWNMSRALSGVLEEEASRTVKLADSLFNTVADSVERGLGESMRTVSAQGVGCRV
jgi:hypothetical protein